MNHVNHEANQVINLKFFGKRLSVRNKLIKHKVLRLFWYKSQKIST